MSKTNKNSAAFGYPFNGGSSKKASSNASTPNWAKKASNSTPAPASKPTSPTWSVERDARGNWISVPLNKQAMQQSVMNHAYDIVSRAMPPQAVTAVKVAQAVNQMLPPGKQVNATNIQKAFKGLPGTVDSSTGGTTMNASYGLSKAPNPKAVHLNSGIMPNAYSNDYMVPMLNSCSPMHVNNVIMGIPTSATHPLNVYFLNTIAFDVQTRAQSNITFNIDVANTLTTANLLTAMNAGIRALQVYYFYASILSYESDARNKNSAMIALRNLLTPQLISDLAVLGRRLEDTPMPPRLVEWVRYLSMNFLSGDSQGSPIIKFGADWDCLTAVNAVSLASAALTGLNAGSNNAVFSLIRRAIPKWRIGTLYDVPTTPVFDKNFVTIFANSPQQYQDTGSTYRATPSVTLATDAIAYNSYNNKLDGAAYVCCSANMSGTWYPGLFTPITNGANPRSRLSYYTNGTTATWYGTDLYSFLTSAREETYQIQYPNNVAPVSVHLFGSDKLQGVSINSLLQTAQNFLDFLFAVDQIPVRGKLSSFNRKGNNKI